MKGAVNRRPNGLGKTVTAKEIFILCHTVLSSQIQIIRVLSTARAKIKGEQKQIWAEGSPFLYGAPALK